MGRGLVLGKFMKTHWLFLVLISASLPGLALAAPQKTGASKKSDAPQNGKQADDKDKKETPQAALNRFADAANFQNNSAFDLAIEEWNKLLKEFPDDPIASKAHHYLGVCYLRKDTPDYDAAIASLEQALKDSNLEVREESLFDLGLSLYLSGRDQKDEIKQKKLERSLKAFRALLQDYPDSGEADKAIFYSGECEYLLGRREQAVKTYTQMTKNQNYAKSAIRPDALYALGVAYEELKKEAQAKDTFEEFIQQYGEHKFASDVRLRQAEVALRANDFASAVAILGKLVESNKASMPDYALYRYAFALAKAGDFKNSASMYQRLAKEYPNSQYASSASLATGQTLMRDRRYDEARPYFEQLLAAKDETAAEAAHWLCQICILQGRPPEAAPIAKQALTWGRNSKFGVALEMDLADAVIDLPQGREEALKSYQMVATNFPEDPLAIRATYNCAFTFLQMGNPTEAKNWSERFIAKYSKDDLAADARYVQAEAELQLGARKEAIEHFSELIRDYPKNPILNTWKLRLATAKFLNGEFEPTIALIKKELPSFKEPEQQAEAHFLLGASALRSNQAAQAIKSFELCRSVGPKWSQVDEATLLLSQAFQQNNELDRAKQTLKELIQEYPNSRFKVQAQYRLGQFAANAGEYPQALALYDEILGKGERSPNLDFVAYAKAFVLMQMEKYDDSIAILKPLAVASRNDGVGRESRLALAINHRKKGELKESLAILSQVIQANDGSDYLAKGLYEFGISSSQNKDYPAAIESFLRIRKEFTMFGGMDKVLFELAWCYKEQGKNEEAAEVFRQLAKEYPNSDLAGEANYHVGQGLYEQKDFGKAVEAYSAAYSNSKDLGVKEKSLHKMGWALFKEEAYDKAEARFQQQIDSFPEGELRVDGLFMKAQCSFKKEAFGAALEGYAKARASLEAHPSPDSISDSIRALIYLHGAQCLRELKKFDQTEAWLKIFVSNYAQSPFLPEALYEMAYCYQNQQKTDEALKLYSEVASKYRTEISARARFMMGEVYFAKREFPKAISEYQRVMYGYDGKQAPDEIKNWQARSAMEAGRCAETLINGQKGDRLTKSIGIARDFYQFVVDNHPNSDLAPQAEIRLAALKKLEQ